ncbi:hypothetical protein LUZ61_005712 [Rhynchospora tenuis]|uniref:Uncharacterized protein n=1 Tax=Rhynchospora tenuis TaxID=198213 RepID=A0AAD5ZQ68_9POAL|nr:hypothetical protein LUZ61_005712 [Rhynchospora tenuis]
MEKRSHLLTVFAMFLMLSYLLPLSAVPLSRDLALKTQNLSATEIPNQATTTKEGQNLGEEMARMDAEINDYPSPHPNPRHDPTRPPSG